MLDTESIIAELEAERDRLAKAIAFLQGSRAVRRKGRRPPLSAAARRRISEGMKKRWAARKSKAT